MLRGRHRHVPALIWVVVAVLVTAGCGSDAPPTRVAAKSGDTVKVVMTDNAFSIDELDVRVGSVITFVFDNQGAVGHEAVIGNRAAQDMHMSNGHAGMDPDSSVEVGRAQRRSLTYTFADTGVMIVGCHQPGHYEAGMKFVVRVT